MFTRVSIFWERSRAWTIPAMGDSKRKRTDSEVDSSSENEKEVNIEAPSSSQAKKNSESEQFWELGSKKRVTLRSWKGSRLIDIREFYGEENDMKPGKKG